MRRSGVQLLSPAPQFVMFQMLVRVAVITADASALCATRSLGAQKSAPNQGLAHFIGLAPFSGRAAVRPCSCRGGASCIKQGGFAARARSRWILTTAGSALVMTVSVNSSARIKYPRPSVVSSVVVRLPFRGPSFFAQWPSVYSMGIAEYFY